MCMNWNKTAKFIIILFNRKNIISSQIQGEVEFLALIGTCSLNIYKYVNKEFHISCCLPKIFKCVQLMKMGLSQHGTLCGDERHEKMFILPT
jgi:hypothetical protein